MKKVKFLILPLTAAAVLLSACGGEPINQGPELRGINDITCLVNSTVDLLNGVAALDAEDGDITPNLSITVIPAVEVNNGGIYRSRRLRDMLRGARRFGQISQNNRVCRGYRTRRLYVRYLY